jgi:hypothetical protein
MNNKFGKNLINIELNKAKLPYSEKIHSQTNFVERLRLDYTFKEKEKQKILENLQREVIYAKIAEIKRSESNNEPMSLYKNHQENYLRNLNIITDNINMRENIIKRIERNMEGKSLFSLLFRTPKYSAQNIKDLSNFKNQVSHFKNELSNLYEIKSEFPSIKNNYTIISNKIEQSLESINSYIKNPNIINKGRIGNGVYINN